jgi:8-amino-7-oxononanoate synthase
LQSEGVTFHVKRSSSPALDYLHDALDALRARDEYRERATATEDPSRSFFSNDYLALSSITAPRIGSGTGASRVVCGDHDKHREAEQEAASLVGHPASLTFTSGYAANVGLLSALLDRHSFAVIDSLCHASIIDGIRLSRAHMSVVPHCDTSAVADRLRRSEGRRAFVVTESYFSMDADSPDLEELRSICDRAGAALLVDEAHALGVLGPEGRGLCVERRVQADAVIGTFGKSFGAGGAFVAGSEALISWLWNRARSFVFSTGLSPVLAAAAMRGMRTAATEPARRERVLEAAHELRTAMGALGLSPLGYGHIVPWVVGSNSQALRVSRSLAERGINTRAIRPPSVPTETARLRLTLSACHTSSDVSRLVDAIAATV